MSLEISDNVDDGDQVLIIGGTYGGKEVVLH
jgi:hypothetical protein